MVHVELGLGQPGNELVDNLLAPVRDGSSDEAALVCEVPHQAG